MKAYNTTYGTFYMRHDNVVALDLGGAALATGKMTSNGIIADTCREAKKTKAQLSEIMTAAWKEAIAK